MFKKASIAIFSALLAAVSVAGIASAEVSANGKKGDHDGRRQQMMIGQITSLGADSFTINALDDETHTIAVDAETVFKERGADPETEISFTNLAEGDWIGVYTKEDLAKLVVLLPEDFDPESLKGRRAAGEIQMVSNGANFFKLETREGETLTIQVDETTRYSGGVAAFDDLEKGRMVGVLAQEQSDGTLLAKAVAARKDARPNLDKTSGTISAVDANSITIQDREDESHDFALNEETRIISRDQSTNVVEDLEAGMPVAVLTNPEADPESAVAVMVLDEAILSLERAGGEITSIDDDSLTIENKDGSLTFSLTAETKVRGRGIDSLDGLETGQRVIVLFRMEADGSLTAVGIGAARPAGPAH